MRLRRAVLQTLAKPSVPPRLPFHKNDPPLTPSESTLPQLLIPRHFNSCISNTYKKPRGGAPPETPKFANSSLPPPPSTTFTATPLAAGNPRLLPGFAVSVPTQPQTFNPQPHLHAPFRNTHPPSGCQLSAVGSPATPLFATLTKTLGVGQPILAVSLSLPTEHGSPATLSLPTGPQVPLRPAPQSARITDDIALKRPGKHPRSSRCLIRESGQRRWQRRKPPPDASRSRQHRDRTRKKAWVQRSNAASERGPNRRVARANYRAGKAGSVRMGRRPFLGPR